MKLYHGSNVDIDTIDLKKCRPNKDFGCGFYLTDIYEQAQKMALRVSRLYGGNPTVNCFEVDIDKLFASGLSIRKFDEANKEWAFFVMNNRGKSDADTLTDSNFDNRFDVVIGPVANDDMAMLFRQFESGFITEEILVKEMKYKQMTSQYSFHTQKAITFLRKVCL